MVSKKYAVLAIFTICFFSLKSAQSSITFCGNNKDEWYDYIHVWAGLEDKNGNVIANFPPADNTILCSNPFCHYYYKKEGYTYPTIITFDTGTYTSFDLEISPHGTIWTNVGKDYPSPGNYYLAANGYDNPYLSTISCYDAVSRSLSQPTMKKLPIIEKKGGE